ncbi:MAG: RNA polymerase sigma factor [Planctomycetales bacterium]
MIDDEAKLVEACRGGDPTSLAQFVAHFERPVYAVCYRMLGHLQDAEDITQEVFLRAFRSLGRWDADRPLKPWLFTIAVNCCKTALVNRRKWGTSTDLSQEWLAPVESAGRTDLAEELQRGLDSLRDEYRTCFILFHEQDLSCAEIGKLLGCPEGTVKTWLFRARRELAEQLRKRGIFPDTKP